MADNKFKGGRLVRLVAIASASCIALSACGGSSDSKGSSGGGGGDKIVIGYGASQSGPQANNGLVGVAVAKAWAEKVNADGGINGNDVEIKAVDTKSAPPAAVAAFKGFQNDDSVDAILWTDLVAENAMADTFKDAGIAVMSGGASADQIWYEIPGLYQPVSGQRVLPALYSNAAKSGGADALGFAACQEVASCAENAKPTQAVAKTLGVADAGTQIFAATATDYTAQCLAFKEKGAKAIAMNIGIDTGVRVMADCLQQGFDGFFIMPNTGFDQTKVDKVAGAETVDVTQGFPWWADTPQVKEYRDAMAKYSPDQAATGGGATSVWAMLELFKKQLTAAGDKDITRESIIAALDATKDETLDGLLAQPITFTKGEASPFVKCSWVFKFNAGDENPTTLPATGAAGNGAKGDLASVCVDAE